MKRHLLQIGAVTLGEVSPADGIIPPRLQIATSDADSLAVGLSKGEAAVLAAAIMGWARTKEVFA